jgi:quinolinate synthase
VNSLPENDILFIPDMCLDSYVSAHTSKRVILYPGYCGVHMMLKRDDVGRARRLYPDAETIVHPECSPEVTPLADQVMGTSQMMQRLKKENSKKEPIQLSNARALAETGVDFISIGALTHSSKARDISLELEMY